MFGLQCLLPVEEELMPSQQAGVCPPVFRGGECLNRQGRAQGPWGSSRAFQQTPPLWDAQATSVSEHEAPCWGRGHWELWASWSGSSSSPSPLRRWRVSGPALGWTAHPPGSLQTSIYLGVCSQKVTAVCPSSHLGMPAVPQGTRALPSGLFAGPIAS